PHRASPAWHSRAMASRSPDPGALSPRRVAGWLSGDEVWHRRRGARRALWRAAKRRPNGKPQPFHRVIVPLGSRRTSMRTRHWLPIVALTLATGCGYNRVVSEEQQVEAAWGQ